jgi:P27 family predicted phage terminase small subunit
MRGRKPKPTCLKLVDGNPGRRPIKQDDFSPAAVIPECPAHLQGEARAEWDRLTQLLDEYGMVSEADRGALAMICTLWGRYVAAETVIEAAAKKLPGSYGLFVKSPNDFPVQSPWLAVSNKAMEKYHQMCAEFGLTPSSRARVSLTTSQPDESAAQQATGTARFFRV